MSKFARDTRVIERGMNNLDVVRRRNRKASKQFDRWWNGLLVWRFYGSGRWRWERLPSGRGLIHKGRKP